MILESHENKKSSLICGQRGLVYLCFIDVTSLLKLVTIFKSNIILKFHIII